MSRSSNRLAAVALTKLQPGLHHDGLGLYLQVTATGARTWVFRFSRQGRARSMGLGSLHTVSLAEARGKAKECRRGLLEGRDPIDERQATRDAAAIADATAMTFRDCAEGYIKAHQFSWKSAKHAAQWPSTLSAYVYPVFGGLPVGAVDVGLVMRVLEQNVALEDQPPASLWTTKSETANRVRGRVESVLDWAAARGYRAGENPARWKGHLENLLPKKSKVRRVEHHAALPYPELPAFIAELRQQDGIAARALEFAILTAARTGEIVDATWPEIDLEGRLWVVPGSRMKAGREHRVPLSEAAVGLLRAAYEDRTGARIFPISNMAMLMLLRRMGRGDLTAHGFRSTFSDWVAERTNFPSEVREMALAHVVGDKVEAAYRRGDLFEKRRELSEAWAGYCEHRSAEVIQIAARGQ